MDNDDVIRGGGGFTAAVIADNSTLWGTSTGFVQMIGGGGSTTPMGTKVHVTKENGMPVKIFFELMKKKMGVLKDYSYQRRIDKLIKAVEKAEKDGQIAFGEELLKRLCVLSREAEIYAVGKRIFLSREVFDKFKTKTPRPIALTPLKNFARVIPDSVLTEKACCDEFKLFDAYAVMHYDDNKTVKETEQDKKERRQRDPILFGVIKYSEKLYFVDDWEDEFCDLTLDDIIDKLDLDDADITMGKEITI